MASKAVGTRSEPDPELARLLLQTAIGDDLDYAYLGRKHASTARATREGLEQSLVPLGQLEPKLDGSLTKPLHDHLCTIGAKIRPDLSSDQANAWVRALLVAFSDLPAHVAAKAARRALHIPFQFPSEVEAQIRELATEHMDRIRAAIGRARAVERAIHDALNPKPQLVDDTPLAKGEKVLPTDEVHKLQRLGGACKAVVDLGVSKGFITPDQLLPPDDPTLPQEDRT